MYPRSTRRARRRRERGIALAAVAISITAFFALAVVAVDLGRLAHTATEVQTVADVAATAGAMALLKKTANPVGQAISVAAQNNMNAAAANLGPGAIELGHYDWTTGAFVAGGLPQDAVRATANTTVQNIVAAIFGEATTQVTKTATAATGGVGSGGPVLPIVIGQCKFNVFQGSNNCADLPSLTQAPNTSDNSGWTSLSALAASASQAQSYLPSSCGGGGLPSPPVHVGDSVNVLNGSAASILQTIKQCFNQGITQYLIPIVACGSSSQFNQAMTVTGFATITVTSVQTSGSSKGINLSAICQTSAAGGIGGGNFGTETVALVR